MYVDVAYKAQGGKKHKRTLLRESYREDGKVKKKTIANISDCKEEEIEAIKLALKHKGNLGEIGSVKGRVKSRQGLSVGAIVLLKAIADRLHITKSLGVSRMGKLALWQVIARVIDQGSRLSAVRLANTHAICDLINLGSFNEDDLYINLNRSKRGRFYYSSTAMPAMVSALGFLYFPLSTKNCLESRGHVRSQT